MDRCSQAGIAVNARPLYTRCMRFLELFAGAGGASCGIHAAGHSSVGIEWDADAVATAQAAGHDTRLGDVRDLELLRSLGEFDAIWSSFPCQAWSGAGKRQGAKDEERNGWPWTLAAIDEIKPRHFVAENVTGLTHHRGECARGCIGAHACPRAYFDVEIIEALRARFAVVEWRILNAADFGVPQHRRRVIVQAGEVVRWPEPTHAAPGTAAQGDLFGRTLAPWVTVRSALGLGDDRVIGGGANSSAAGQPKARTYRDITEEPCTSIAASQIGNAMPWILDRPAPAVCAMPGGKGCGQWSANQAIREALEASSGRRRLTVEECARLQGFPGGYPFAGSNRQTKYTQIGNAVPPALAQAITKEISC